MRLHTREWGSGDRVALLMHGISGDSASWAQVGPALADRGYRVIAVDFRGHGRSPRAPSYEPAAFADDLLESVPARPALAIGHSLGGWVLAMVVDRLQPGLAVYEDPAWDVTADEQVEIAGFLRSLPTPPEFDRAVLAGLLPGRSYDDSPPAATVPSLLMLADPSDRVSPDEAAGFRRRGFTVSTVPGAGHDIHAEDLAGFLACFDRWARAVADPQETGR